MTTGLVAAIERIDDIPLLLAQMEKIQLAKILDEQFPMHGNWDGLGLGHIVEIWGYQELLGWFLNACQAPNPAADFAAGLLTQARKSHTVTLGFPPGFESDSAAAV